VEEESNSGACQRPTALVNLKAAGEIHRRPFRFIHPCPCQCTYFRAQRLRRQRIRQEVDAATSELGREIAGTSL